jgi:hypothetical protein
MRGRFNQERQRHKQIQPVTAGAVTPAMTAMKLITQNS